LSEDELPISDPVHSGIRHKSIEAEMLVCQQTDFEDADIDEGEIKQVVDRNNSPNRN